MRFSEGDERRFDFALQETNRKNRVINILRDGAFSSRPQPQQRILLRVENRAKQQSGQKCRAANAPSDGNPHFVSLISVSYTHLRAHETPEHLVCRLLLEKK